jgi:hypothetical protein
MFAAMSPHWPILVQYKKEHPAPPPRPTPICKGQ